ncbi:hypothetical protein Q5P01_000735 [Channa striata]|uniref:Uncharacterized protein n=1 Tax=Channa striata TaxID=64152 RepID=A0AA88LFN6_CHASR|nr:hypothetical protein Q5P01_000735 [Channa striata]
MSRLLLFVIVRLLGVARLSLGDPRRPAYVLDKGNLRNCRGGTNYCSSAIEGDGVLLECTADGKAVCGYQCPLGHPIVTYVPRDGYRCAAKCPRGRFVQRVNDVHQACRLHRPGCPEGQSPILRGTAWHDLICGKPGDYRWPRSLLDRIDSKAFRSTLDELASAWIPGVDEESLRKLCSYFSGSPKGFKSIAQCVNSARHLLTSMGENTAEYMFYTLNTIRMYATAQRMFDAVVKPFFPGRKDLEPKVDVVFETSEPLWAGDGDTFTVTAKITIPLGANDKYRIFAFNWYANGLDKWLLGGDPKLVKSSNESRYSTALGTGWLKHHEGFLPGGFFVSTHDISLTVKDFSCASIDSLSAMATVFNVSLDPSTSEPRSTLTPHKSLSVGCLWRPRSHPDCDCDRDMLRFASPTGPCSPLCTSRAFRQSYRGEDGNDWTLEVSGEPLDASASEGRGRVLHGSVTRKTERFCVTTSGVFATSPGPELRSPTAPLDVRRCDVMLLQVPVWTREPPGSGEDDRHVRIPVRYSSAGGGSSDRVDVYVERTVEETLRAVARQGWGSEVGVRLKFIPGLSAGVLADVMRVRYKNTEYARFRCAGTSEKCSNVRTLYDQKNNTIYKRSEHKPLLGCAGVSLPHQGCVVCRDGARTVIAMCPKHLSPQTGTATGASDLGSPRWLDTRDLEQAEIILLDVGRLVSSHGAFLDLDTIGVFRRSEAGCGRTAAQPGRWKVGRYDPVEPYAIRLPREELRPERTGLSVFEELCWRSNNRAGIVVTLPSARYEPSANCLETKMLNRHVPERGASSNSSRVYSVRELAAIVEDRGRVPGSTGRRDRAL